jgi:hypothetical protein
MARCNQSSTPAQRVTVLYTKFIMEVVIFLWALTDVACFASQLTLSSSMNPDHTSLIHSAGTSWWQHLRSSHCGD